MHKSTSLLHVYIIAYSRHDIAQARRQNFSKLWIDNLAIGHEIAAVCQH